MRNIAVATTLLLALFLGVATAFFRPASPYQVPENPVLSGHAAEEKTTKNLMDNPDVVEDKNIHPARKCGFCMG